MHWLSDISLSSSCCIHYVGPINLAVGNSTPRHKLLQIFAYGKGLGTNQLGNYMINVSGCISGSIGLLLKKSDDMAVYVDADFPPFAQQAYGNVYSRGPAAKFC